MSAGGAAGRKAMAEISLSHCLSVCLLWLLQIKRFIGTDQEMLRIHERLLAGSLAGAIAQSSIYPMEVRQEAGPSPRGLVDGKMWVEHHHCDD